MLSLFSCLKFWLRFRDIRLCLFCLKLFSSCIASKLLSLCLSPSVMLYIYGLLFGTGETVTIVGDQDPSMMKYFDCTRSGPRSPFDSNVVYQFEIMEYVWILNSFVQ